MSNLCPITEAIFIEGSTPHKKYTSTYKNKDGETVQNNGFTLNPKQNDKGKWYSAKWTVGDENKKYVNFNIKDGSGKLTIPGLEPIEDFGLLNNGGYIKAFDDFTIFVDFRKSGDGEFAAVKVVPALKKEGEEVLEEKSEKKTYTNKFKKA